MDAVRSMNSGALTAAGPPSFIATWKSPTRICPGNAFSRMRASSMVTCPTM